MKAQQGKIPAALTALFLGGYVWAPAFAASPEQQPGAATPAQTGKTGDACASFDKDRDGHLSFSEWKARNKNVETFMLADANQDGRLDLTECARVLGG